MSDKLDKLMKNCVSKAILDIYNFFTKEQIKSLEKLGIILENRKYTINEFDKLDEKIREYYKSEDKLKQKGILKQEYLSLLDVLNNIAIKYEL